MNTEHEENKNEDEAEFVPEDGEGNVESAEAKLKKLREELKQCQMDKQEYLTLSQRLKADYMNFEKATESRRGEIIQFANQALLLDLLDLTDSFELAFADQTAWSAVGENWRKGVEYIYTKLVGILKDHGLEALNPLDEPFDPASHESLESVAVDKEDQDGRVVAVMKKGYRLQGKVLRPAQVKVGAFNKK
ncbi:MAG: nucleotide exchange factor GrpE [Candidatus Vogelbacteria bacterium]